MSWSCGVCDEDDTVVPVDAACHHCGVVLCRAHQRRVLDTAVGGDLPGTRRLATHCPSCAAADHPWSLAALRGRLS